MKTKLFEAETSIKWANTAINLRHNLVIMGVFLKA